MYGFVPILQDTFRPPALDLNGRKQYRYHADWNAVRSETKFHRLFDFGNSLPLLRKKVQADISKKELTAEKVVATTVKLMEETSIRIGNNGYEKLYGSYGLTTLKDKHVTVSSDKAIFCFTGKKGIEHQDHAKKQKAGQNNKTMQGYSRQGTLPVLL